MKTRNNVREFTKHDWDIFAGAERWDDGKEPLITEINEYSAICDKSGVLVVSMDEGDEWFLKVSFPTQAAAIVFLGALEFMDSWDLEQMGFAQIS